MSTTGREGGAELEAGRALDERIAVEVMGLRWDESRCRVCGWTLAASWMHGCVVGSCSMRPVPVVHADAPRPYSLEIGAAWSVVEKLRADGWDIGIEDFHNQTKKTDCWRVDLHRDDNGDVEDAFASTVPLAICKAALQAVARATPNDSSVNPSETAP